MSRKKKETEEELIEVREFLKEKVNRSKPRGKSRYKWMKLLIENEIKLEEMRE
jgi:hypothetical protein